MHKQYIPIDLALPQGHGSWELTKKDFATLSQVHPHLADYVYACSRVCPVPFVVFEGIRSPIRQRKLVKAGKSKTLNSRHITGHAVDLVPLVKGAPVWDANLCATIAHYMFALVGDNTDALRWGGTWDDTDDTANARFYDGPHFELPKREPYIKPVPASALDTSSPKQIVLHQRVDPLPRRLTPVSEQPTAKPVNRTRKSEDTVRYVQIALNKFALTVGGIPIAEDGRMGPSTLNAIRIVQKAIGARQDGLWGPATEKAFGKWLSEHTRAGARSTPPLTLLAGADNEQPAAIVKEHIMSGKKTYIIAVLTLLGALGGYFNGTITLFELFSIAQTSAIGAALRSGLSNTLNSALSGVLGAGK